MSNIKKKIIISSLMMIALTEILLIVTNSKNNEKQNIDNMLSYTLDGEIISSQPTKEKGYIVNKIMCEGNSNISFDNTNWIVEMLDISKEDRCTIDFTKDKNTSGYRVEVISDIENSVDSTSKATINGGTIRFYPKEEYVITSVSGCTGTVKDGHLEINNVTGNMTCNVAVASGLIAKSYSNPFTSGTLAYQILFNNQKRYERTNFVKVFGSSTPTDSILYEASGGYTEDESTVYYFAGNVSNNWVKFGKDENNADLYWRIIRTNEDGSVRLLYAGTSPDTEEGYISVDGQTRFAYNDSLEDAVYAGWMYGTKGSLSNNRTNQTNNSIAKQTVDTWYSRGLNTKTDTSGNKYDAYISKTAIYCNDRSGDSWFSNAGNTGYIYFGSFYRLNAYPYPSYACGMKSDKSGLNQYASVLDKFTVSKTTGNGLLDNPVGLMTADEVAMAGGRINTNNPYAYYHLNSSGGSIVGENLWWTMSPYAYSGYSTRRYRIVAYVDGSHYNPGNLIFDGGYYTPYVLRPVISLKSCAAYKSGNGIWNTPYEVSINSTCATAEN